MEKCAILKVAVLDEKRLHLKHMFCAFFARHLVTISQISQISHVYVNGQGTDPEPLRAPWINGDFWNLTSSDEFCVADLNFMTDSWPGVWGLCRTLYGSLGHTNAFIFFCLLSRVFVWSSCFMWSWHNSQVALSEAEAAGSRVTASALDMEKLLVELLGDGVGMTFNGYIWLYHVITMGWDRFLATKKIFSHEQFFFLAT